MINEKFQDLNTYLRQLDEAEGENLVAVVVYGSAVTTPETSARSDFQWLVITRRLAAADLRRIRPIIRALVKAGYTMPAFFTAQEFEDSLDVFPIEFRQMKRAYQVLHGPDLLATTEASGANLRLQIEYELRGKLLRLRSLFLPASDSAESLLRLMTESVVSFVRIMRSILELVGEVPAVGRLEATRQVGESLKADLTPIITLLELRTNRRQLTESETQELFEAYISSLTEVIEAVDKISPE